MHTELYNKDICYSSVGLLSPIVADLATDSHAVEVGLV